MQYRYLTISHIFLEKSYTKCGKETISRPFFKKSKLTIPLDQYWKFQIFCFNFLPGWGLSKVIETKLQTICFTSYKAFFIKKRFGTSLPTSLSAWVLKKNISIFVFYYLTKFHCLFTFTSWDIGQYGYCNCLLTRLWRQKFWN